MKKIVLFIFLSFLVSFSVFFILISIIYEKQENIIIENEKKYYNSIKEIKNKIFLVGGSHISALNPYLIENF